MLIDHNFLLHFIAYQICLVSLLKSVIKNAGFIRGWCLKEEVLCTATVLQYRIQIGLFENFDRKGKNQ